MQNGGEVVVVERVSFGTGFEGAEDGKVGEVSDFCHFCGCEGVRSGVCRGCEFEIVVGLMQL